MLSKRNDIFTVRKRKIVSSLLAMKIWFFSKRKKSWYFTGVYIINYDLLIRCVTYKSNFWFPRSWFFVKLVLIFVENQWQVFRARINSEWLMFFVFSRPHTCNNLCSSEFTHRTQSNAIHWIPFDWGRLPNPIKHTLMDGVPFGLICSIEFDWFGNRTHRKFGVRFGLICRTQSNSIYGLSSTEYWVRFANVRLTMPEKTHTGCKWQWFINLIKQKSE